MKKTLTDFVQPQRMQNGWQREKGCYGRNGREAFSQGRLLSLPGTIFLDLCLGGLLSWRSWLKCHPLPGTFPGQPVEINPISLFFKLPSLISFKHSCCSGLTLFMYLLICLLSSSLHNDVHCQDSRYHICLVTISQRMAYSIAPISVFIFT